MPSGGHDFDRICRGVAVMPLLPPVEPSSLARVVEQVGALPPWLEALLLVSDGLMTHRGVLMTAARILEETLSLLARRSEDEQFWSIVISDLVPFFRETAGPLLAYHRKDRGIYRIGDDVAYLAHLDWSEWLACELRRALGVLLGRALKDPVPVASLEGRLKGCSLPQLVELRQWVLEGAEVTLPALERELRSRRREAARGFRARPAAPTDGAS